LTIIRQIAKNLLRKKGFGVYQIGSNEFINFENYLSTLLKIDGFVKYLQVGTHDGVMVDPMYGFVAEKWKSIQGLLLEPIPSSFDKLQKNYSKYPSILPVNVAIHNTNTVMEMFTVNEKKAHRYPEHVSGMSSFSKENLTLIGHVIEEDIMSVQVQCKTVESILRQYELIDINLMIIDTEGYDYDILSELNFGIINPKIVRFEHGLASYLGSDQKLFELSVRMNSFDYQVVVDNNDAILVKTSFLVNALEKGSERS
jgi:FkbM family methyltransferase